MRTDLDLHSHFAGSDEDINIVSALSEHEALSEKEPGASIPAQDKQEIAVLKLDLVHSSPASYSAKLEAQVSSGALPDDEVCGLRESTAGCYSGLHLSSDPLSSVRDPSGLGSRVQPCPASLYFSDDSSRSSSPNASLPEPTAPRVQPHGQSIASAHSSLPIDSSFHCFLPISPHSDSAFACDAMHAFNVSTDQLGVPGLGLDRMGDEFDVCEWEATDNRGTPSPSLRVHTLSEVLLSKGDEVLTRSDDHDSEDEFVISHFPATINLFGPDCLQDLSDIEGKVDGSDEYLHLDMGEEEVEYSTEYMGRHANKGCNGSVIDVEKVSVCEDWEGVLFDEGE